MRRELANQKEKVLQLQDELARAKFKLAEAVVEAKLKLREMEVSKPEGA